MSEHMNRTQADLEDQDRRAADSFGIDTDPQHRYDPTTAPEDRERQPAHQPENREPAIKDHAPGGLPDTAFADSGSSKPTAVNYQGDGVAAQDREYAGTEVRDHEVQGKTGKTSKK